MPTHRPRVLPKVGLQISIMGKSGLGLKVLGRPQNVVLLYNYLRTRMKHRCDVDMHQTYKIVFGIHK